MNFILNINDSLSSRAPELLEYRLKNNIWGLHNNTRWKTTIKKDDNILFYIAGKSKHKHYIVASAKVLDISDGFPRNDLPRFANSEMALINYPQYKIELHSIIKFKNPVRLPSIMHKLNIFKKKAHKRWGVYIQGGVKKIDNDDYAMIMSESK